MNVKFCVCEAKSKNNSVRTVQGDKQEKTVSIEEWINNKILSEGTVSFNTITLNCVQIRGKNRFGDRLSSTTSIK